MALTAVHGSKQVVLCDEFNLNQYLRSAKQTQEVTIHDITTLGATARAKFAGLKDGRLSIEGFADISTDALNDILLAALGNANGNVISFAKDSFAVGKPVSLFLAKEASFEVGGSVDDLVHAVTAIEADGGIDNGVSLRDITAAETSAGAGTNVDHGAATTNGGVGHLHVLAFTGTNAVIKIRHSADNVTYADLLTFATATGLTKERKTVAGTVNRHIKFDLSGTFTSILFALSFARR